MDKEIIRLNADVPRSLYDKFKIRLIKDRMDIKGFINTAIEKYLKSSKQ